MKIVENTAGFVRKLTDCGLQSVEKACPQEQYATLLNPLEKQLNSCIFPIAFIWLFRFHKIIKYVLDVNWLSDKTNCDWLSPHYSVHNRAYKERDLKMARASTGCVYTSRTLDIRDFSSASPVHRNGFMYAGRMASYTGCYSSYEDIVKRNSKNVKTNHRNIQHQKTNTLTGRSLKLNFF